MRNQTLKEFREQFEDWCWSLTVDEITSNTELMAAIENLETLLMLAID